MTDALVSPEIIISLKMANSEAMLPAISFSLKYSKFSYNLKSNQKKAIENVLAGHDTLCIFPTGKLIPGK